MIDVQVNTGDGVAMNQDGIERISAKVNDALGRFEDQITRVELHLRDENLGAESGDDIQCSLEVRPTGHQPVTVSHNSGMVEDAVSGAAKKMQRRLESVLGKRSDVKGGESIRTSRI